MDKMDNMKRMSATDAKQNFGAALTAAAVAPVAIQKHGRTVAYLAAAPAGDGDIARARERQLLVEQRRLIDHQRLALRLLRDPVGGAALVSAARQVVDRWAAQQSCSGDYVAAWRKLLALPVEELAERMCGDLNGWGTALRQNSPWPMVLR